MMKYLIAELLQTKVHTLHYRNAQSGINVWVKLVVHYTTTNNYLIVHRNDQNVDWTPIGDCVEGTNQV